MKGTCHSHHTSYRYFCTNEYIIISIIFLWVIFGHSASHALNIKDEQNYSLTDNVYYTVEASTHMKISEILASDLRWQKNEKTTLNFGFMSSPIWLRIDLKNNTDDSIQKLLELSYPAIDILDIYIIRNNNVITQQEAGDKRFFNVRPIKHRNFIFPIDFPSGETSIVIRAQTHDALQLPLKLYNPKQYWEKDQTITFSQGIYYGIIFVMAIYNLFIFIVLRESTYLFYVFYAVSFGLFQGTLHGLTFQYLWPAQTWWQEVSTALFVNLSVVFGLLFSTSFLMLNKQNIFLDKVIKTTAGFVAFVALCGLFLPTSWSIRMASMLVIPSVSLIMCTGLYSWINGQQSARLFVLAWIALLVGSLALAFNKFGFIQRTFITESGIQIGSVIELVLLSVALADRISEERTQKSAAQQALILTKEKARADLEQRVGERTQALEEAMTELSQVNSKLEQLSTTDSLTNVYNRRFFDDALNREWQRGLRTQLPLSLILLDIDKFKVINDSYGHIVGDECIQQIAQIISHRICRTNDVIARYGGEEFAVILPHVKCGDAAKVAESLRVAIASRPLTAGDQQLQITASFGTACMIPSREVRADILIRRADDALYSAKRNGRNRVELYTQASVHSLQ